MIERSRANALAAEIPAEFKQAAFGELARSFAPQSFDALLCLGNSLPHLLSPGERLDALRDFADCLRPGGLIILQNRNFDAVMTRREHWMEPQSHQKDGAEWVFLRLYDYLPDGLIDFHIVVLRRLLGEGWRQQVNTTRLAPLLQADLTAQLASTGFDRIAVFGGLDGSAFDPQKSANLVITARKS
jgi:SAM-dependent methyltransferase